MKGDISDTARALRCISRIAERYVVKASRLSTAFSLLASACAPACTPPHCLRSLIRRALNTSTHNARKPPLAAQAGLDLRCSGPRCRQTPQAEPQRKHHALAIRRDLAPSSSTLLFSYRPQRYAMPEITFVFGPNGSFFFDCPQVWKLLVAEFRIYTRLMV